jgi:type IV pilus assembly protein PilM
MPAVNLIHRLRRWFRAPVEVQLVCEIAADYVIAARYQGGRIEAWALQPLPLEAVRPAPLADNILDATVVQEALKQALESVGDTQRRCVLLVPDLVARIALLELEHLPTRADEADGLLRWRLKKDLPFDVNQAVLSYKVQPGRGAAHEVMAVVCLRGLLRQYEDCLGRLGIHPGWVTLSTLATLDCLDPGNTTPQLLVKRDHSSLSLAIVHHNAVRLFRSLPMAAHERRAAAEALFEKIYPAVVYFQDQWNQPVAEVALAGLDERQANLVQQFEHETGCAARDIVAGDFNLPPSVGAGLNPDHRLLPSLGWVRGEEE